jgi:glucose/arabinose dehydrogenase
VKVRIALIAGCLVAMLAASTPADAIELEPVGTFSSPIYVTSPPGDPRLFVVERSGTIQVVDQGTTTEFLDISAMTTTDGERGLLSMAFDPGFATNGLFYVFYTGDGTDSGGVLGQGRVDEYQVSPDPDVADPTSRRPVLTISRPNDAIMHHNGGQLQFGKDGLLYISVGDGGNGGDPARDLSVLNGKLLRIDPHGATAGAYGIPPDNPFVASASARDEIWSSGFRNPWRFSFDHLTGDLVIGDVGQITWEEVDFAPASTGLGRGADWGWNSCEGFYVQGSTSTPCSTPGASDPVFAYPHDDPGGDVATGCAVMGGYVYRGNQIPELSGRYLYADLCAGELRSLQLKSRLATGDRAESAVGALAGPNSFGEDSSCQLYVTNGNAVDKIVPSSPPATAPACQQPTPTAPSPVTNPPTKARNKCKRRKHRKHAASAKKKHCKKKRKKK